MIETTATTATTSKRHSLSTISTSTSTTVSAKHKSSTLFTMKRHTLPSEAFGGILIWSLLLIWPLMCTLPLLLTHDGPTHYSSLFPSSWYTYNPQDENDDNNSSPKPLGLILGILAVAVGHLTLVPMFYLYQRGVLTQHLTPPPIQTQGARNYDFYEGLVTHLSQPEGFVVLTLYLSITWMGNLMPSSYYSFEGGIQWIQVFTCLLLQDGFQYVMHRVEHVMSPEFYQKSHKPHHRFTNPRFFDAFNGSLTDTFCMILIPLYLTATIMRNVNVWTYMTFGSMYANWLVVIHSEYVFPWDGIFRKIGLGTPGDHHVHHKVFKYNYGHLCLWFDWIGGTYRDPQRFAPKLFTVGS